jgi:hypothetical protein
MSYMKRRKEDMDEVLEVLTDVWYLNPHLSLVELIDAASDKEIEIVDETDLDRILVDKLNSYL